jgi:hypothetical protein
MSPQRRQVMNEVYRFAGFGDGPQKNYRIRDFADASTLRDNQQTGTEFPLGNMPSEVPEHSLAVM